MSANVSELTSSSRALGEALRRLVEADLATRGRPSRESRARNGQLAGAPAPELLILPADRLVAEIYRCRDAELLRRVFDWERKHERRRSVLRACQRHLRTLGVHVGGPEREPFPGYDRLGEGALEAKARQLEPRAAARAYAYEWYRRRRQAVLSALRRRAGVEACRRAVEETLGGEPKLPFPGFEKLRASPEGRREVRHLLSQASVGQLRAALEFERRTKQRKVIERALRAEMARRTAG